MDPADFPNRLLGELRLSEGTNNINDNRINDNRSNDNNDGTVWSPDEFVIRQRGRRKFSVWSPETNSNSTQISSPFQRTPTKISSSMILRSSPRKRLTMGSTPEPNEDRNASSPMKMNSIRTQLWADMPGTAKRARLDEPQQIPIAQQSMSVPLSTLLTGYSQNQLIQLILDQVSDEKLDGKITEESLRERLPTPAIDSKERELLHAKRNIFKSLPTSRLCKKTDSVAYSRASLHLNEFKRLLGQHTKELQESCHWDALLDYVLTSWSYVRSTPIWDNTSHNTFRRQCFKLLSSCCIVAIKAAGLRLGLERLRLLEKNLQEWAKDYEDVLLCITTLNKTLTKGRTSL